MQKYARGSTPGPGVGYPDLFIAVTYKIDAKTKLANPATKDHDIKIHCAPFNQGLSDEFHAPHVTLHLEVKGSLITFDFHYTCMPIGSTKIHLGIKDFFGVDKEIAPAKKVALVSGWINTVTGEGDFRCRAFGNFERLHAD